MWRINCARDRWLILALDSLYEAVCRLGPRMSLSNSAQKRWIIASTQAPFVPSSYSLPSLCHYRKSILFNHAQPRPSMRTPSYASKSALTGLTAPTFLLVPRSAFFWFCALHAQLTTLHVSFTCTEKSVSKVSVFWRLVRPPPSLQLKTKMYG